MIHHRPFIAQNINGQRHASGDFQRYPFGQAENYRDWNC